MLLAGCELTGEALLTAIDTVSLAAGSAAALTGGITESGTSHCRSGCRESVLLYREEDVFHMRASHLRTGAFCCHSCSLGQGAHRFTACQSVSKGTVQEERQGRDFTFPILMGRKGFGTEI